jgi:mono/diheme cytochrome c family protein
VWTTFVVGTVVFGIWLVQGLDGAPRRFSVLPERYDVLTRLSLPLVFVLAAAQALFFWNVWATVRGRAGAARFDDDGLPVPPSRRRVEWGPAAAAGAAMLLVLVLVGVGTVTGYVVGRESAERGGAPAATETATAPQGTAAAEADVANGKRVFASAGCGGCHTLADAGATGAVGPSLDARVLEPARIEELVANGSGAMPAFSGRLSEQEIRDVGAYLAGASAAAGTEAPE